jgi:glucose/arabinose dehydrogenase
VKDERKKYIYWMPTDGKFDFAVSFWFCFCFVSVAKARSVKVDKDSERIFVLERGTESIVHLFDSDGDGIPDTKEVVAYTEGLNHGLALFDGYIYASNSTTVSRWPLYDTSKSDNNNDNNDYYEFPLTNPEVVVNNMNEDGNGGAPQGHTTRTLAFDEASGTMYVSVGSNNNVDLNSYRSRIRWVPNIHNNNNNDPDNTGSTTTITFPIDFQTMEVFADGLRNEVGLAFDQHGILWGVENSADNLEREDLGGDIHEDNPAEELNRFDPKQDVGKHYGYPYCWTEYKLPQPPGRGRGTVWAWPSFLQSDTIEDGECRSEEVFVPPVLAMQGHSAPLGITFFNWVPPEERSISCGDSVGVDSSFPEAMDGFAFIAYHGSWNRDIPTGYKVVYVEMDENGDPVGEPIDLLAHQAPDANWEDGFRPVDVAFDACGRLLVTSDGTRGRGSKVVRIDYLGKNGGGGGTTGAEESSAGCLEPTNSLFLCLLWMLLAMR